MKATTNISKEEFLEKIEEAEKLLDDCPKYDVHYVLDEYLLSKIFEIAYRATEIIDNSIPVKWIKKWCGDEPYWSNLAMHLIEDWKEENETEIDWER